MKTIILIAAIAFLKVQNLQAAISVQNLQVNCTMKAVVTEVFNIKYSKGVPAHGRFNGIQPSLSFQASLVPLSQETGCQVLQDKYKIYLRRFSASGGIMPATEDQSSLISALKNQVVELKLQQHIGYQINGYLPLFPQVHSESLNLSFSFGKIFGGVELPFDLNWVYSAPKIENLSDIEKLALAEKSLPYLFTNGDFHSLFLQLEPQQPNLKKSYALLVWKSFKEYLEASPYNYQMLQFHVGGDGSFTGAPLAIKLNVISHSPQSFTPAEIVQLLSDFPTWILAGYSDNDCLNFTADELENFLENVQLKIAVLSLREKSLLKDPLLQIAGSVHYVSSCTEGKVTEKSQALAAEILKSLN